MAEPTIILQGITLEEFRAAIREDIRAEIKQADSEKLRTLSKAEARRQLGGIHFNTLKRLMEAEGISEWNTSLIDTIRLKYPKYRTKVS